MLTKQIISYKGYFTAVPKKLLGLFHRSIFCAKNIVHSNDADGFGLFHPELVE